MKEATTTAFTRRSAAIYILRNVVSREQTGVLKSEIMHGLAKADRDIANDVFMDLVSAGVIVAGDKGYGRSYYWTPLAQRMLDEYGRLEAAAKIAELNI